jgi:hypothetical protein
MMVGTKDAGSGEEAASDDWGSATSTEPVEAVVCCLEVVSTDVALHVCAVASEAVPPVEGSSEDMMREIFE